MNINENVATQKTSDFNVCTVLLYFKHQLIGIDREEPRRCIFILSQERNTNEIIEQFFNGELSVDPKRFIATQKELKSRIYA